MFAESAIKFEQTKLLVLLQTCAQLVRWQTLVSPHYARPVLFALLSLLALAARLK